MGKPHTLVLRHPSGRWIEAILDEFAQLGTYNNPGGGVIFGRDPSCDIVLDDDGIEDFHAHYYARGHHQYIEVIAGEVDDTRGGTIDLGESWRGPWSIRGWQWGDLDDAANREAIAAAISIADDARAEGRHDDEAAILADVGYRRFAVPRRTGLPERLAQSEWILRVRVEGPSGASEVHAVGSRDRLNDGITIGGTHDCDVVAPAAHDSRVRVLERKQHVVFEVEAGTMINLLRVHRFVRQRGEMHQPYSRWERFQVGDAVVQLCRWPRRDETLL